MKKSKLLIMNVIIAIMLLSSCSVTKMRYTRGLNVEFLKRNDKTEINSDKHAKVAVKKFTPNKIAVNGAQIAATESELITETTNNNKVEIVSEFEANKNNSNISSKNKSLNNKIFNSPKTNSSIKLDPKPIQYSDEKKSGVWGILGFICTLIALQPLGLIFCIIGMNRNRKCRGLAIAGFIISILVIIALLATL